MGYKHNIEDIIDKGSELIRKNGYNHVGINEILKACDIPKGSFYNFFETKEDFAEKVIDKYGQSYLHVIKNALSNFEVSPLQRLKDFYWMLIELNEHDGFDGGCLVNNLSSEVGGYNQKISDAADRSFKSWVEEITKCVKEGQEKGEIIGHILAEDIAEYLHAGISGGFSRMKVNKDRIFLDKWHQMTFSFISSA